MASFWVDNIGNSPPAQGGKRYWLVAYAHCSVDFCIQKLEVIKVEIHENQNH